MSTFLLLIILLFIFTIITADHMKSHQKLGAAAIIILSIPIALWPIKKNKNNFPLFELTLVFHVFAFGYPLYVDLPTRRFAFSDHELQNTGLVVVLSSLSLIAGYYIGKKRIITHLSSVINKTKILRADLNDGKQLLVIAYSLWALDPIYRNLNISNLLPLGGLLDATKNFSFVLFSYILFRRNKITDPSSLLCILPLFHALLISLVSGLLAEPFFLLIKMIAVYSYVKKKFPVTFFLLTFLLLLLLNPVKSAYREAHWGNQRDYSSLEMSSNFLELAINNLQESSITQNTDVVISNAIARFENISPLATITTFTPTIIPYKAGETLIELFVGWIPRALWPEKPRSDLGNRWAKWYGLLDDDDFTTSYNLPWIGELYMNFGFTGITLGMIIVGNFILLIEKILFSKTSTQLAFLVGVALTTQIWWMESNIGLSIGNLAIKTISILILFRMLSAIFKK